MFKKYNLLYDFVKYLLNDIGIKMWNKFIFLKLFCLYIVVVDEIDDDDDDEDEW